MEKGRRRARRAVRAVRRFSRIADEFTTAPLAVILDLIENVAVRDAARRYIEDINARLANTDPDLSPDRARTRRRSGELGNQDVIDRA